MSTSWTSLAIATPSSLYIKSLPTQLILPIENGEETELDASWSCLALTANRHDPAIDQSLPWKPHVHHQTRGVAHALAQQFRRQPVCTTQKQE